VPSSARRIAFAAVAVTLVCTAALAIGELAARFAHVPPLTDRLELSAIEPGGRSVALDCYPERPTLALPIDLRRAGDAAAFAQRYQAVVARGGGRSVPTQSRDEFPAPIAAAGAIARLATLAPHCLTYNAAATTLRSLAGAGDTIALLGDSFVVGQGVPDEDTLVPRLAAATGRRVRSYARFGADVADVQAQLARALADRESERLRDVIYVFVLNDPLMSPQLAEQPLEINRLMNVRPSHAATDPRRWARLLASLAGHSALARLLARQLLIRRVGAATIAWYRAVLDPRSNPALERTFDLIAHMRDDATAAGVTFRVAVHPLMMDFGHYPFADEHARVVAALARRGVAVHDLLGDFRREAQGRKLTIHEIDSHPNAIAVGITAQALAASYR